MSLGGTALSDPSPHRPLGCCLLGSVPHCLDSCRTWSHSRHSMESQESEESLLFTSYLDQRRTRETWWHRALLWTRFSLLSSPTSSTVWLVRDCLTGCLDLCCLRHCWPCCSTSWSP